MPRKQLIKDKPATKGLSKRKQTMLLRFISSGKPASAWLEKHKIHSDRLYEQLHKDYAFQVEYSRARKNQAASMVDETISIADNVDEDPASRRVRVNARQWAAGKMDSAAWGDKIDVVLDNRVGLLDHLNDTINVTPTLEAEEE